ncbi:MAG: hypothetical protein AVO35_02450 [Candidatus Aegiribacteria sp. MLS_C]|nr:MAG: hypothetical protein AVO35_02450 [Candidatus Aegiribacteria sp. MLS_C]
MIVQIFVAQCYPEYPLAKQFNNGMINAMLFPVIHEAVGKSLTYTKPLVNFTKENGTSVGGNVASFEISNESPFIQPLEFE